MNDTGLQNRATEIIKPLVPPDAEERVNRSFKQWNYKVVENSDYPRFVTVEHADGIAAISVVQLVPKGAAAVRFVILPRR